MLNFTFCVAHGNDKVAEVSQHSEQMLDELEKEYPVVFSKLVYPIWEHKQPFQIHIIDTKKYPAHHYLYSLSGEEVTELEKQINEWLESGCIVPSPSPHGYPMLFVEKKSRG